LNLGFQQNTATKDIQKLTDVEAVKRSVRNLINLNHYEKPFHPEIGSNLRAMLFENITPQMNHVISKQIDLLIRNFEPRCRLVQVNTQPMFDRNGYRAQISFYVVNHPEPVEVETFLERLR
jgi:phage baseplate assembly protein W